MSAFYSFSINQFNSLIILLGEVQKYLGEVLKGAHLPAPPPQNPALPRNQKKTSRTIYSYAYEVKDCWKNPPSSAILTENCRIQAESVIFH